MTSWIPADVKKKMVSFDDFPPYEKVFTREFVTDLIKQYPIFNHNREGLEWALRLAHETFVGERIAIASRSASLGDQDTALRLYRSLENAIREMRDSRMWVRLNLANRAMFPDGDGIEIASHWFTHARHIEMYLLPIAKAAAELDGRKENKKLKRKMDLKGAAHVLHTAWTTFGGRPAIQDRRGRQTRALQFIIECLWRLDPKAKESSIRGFKTAKSL